MNRKLIICFFVCLLFSFSFAEESVDLKLLTTECVEAAKEHRPIQQNFPYKVIHTVQYEGWIGDSNTFELIHPVIMTIRYAGVSKEGYYFFQHRPQEKHNIFAKSDSEGNFELTENIGDGFSKYKFRGLMKDGIIRGLWETSDANKAYAFYVKRAE